MKTKQNKKSFTTDSVIITKWNKQIQNIKNPNEMHLIELTMGRSPHRKLDSEQLIHIAKPLSAHKKISTKNKREKDLSDVPPQRSHANRH